MQGQTAGHIPSTARAGDVGNFAVARHRDTFFRPFEPYPGVMRSARLRAAMFTFIAYKR